MNFTYFAAIVKYIGRGYIYWTGSDWTGELQNAKQYKTISACTGAINRLNRVGKLGEGSFRWMSCQLPVEQKKCSLSSQFIYCYIREITTALCNVALEVMSGIDLDTYSRYMEGVSTLQSIPLGLYNVAHWLVTRTDFRVMGLTCHDNILRQWIDRDLNSLDNLLPSYEEMDAIELMEPWQRANELLLCDEILSWCDKARFNRMSWGMASHLLALYIRFIGEELVRLCNGCLVFLDGCQVDEEYIQMWVVRDILLSLKEWCKETASVYCGYVARFWGDHLMRVNYIFPLGFSEDYEQASCCVKRLKAVIPQLLPKHRFVVIWNTFSTTDLTTWERVNKVIELPIDCLEDAIEYASRLQTSHSFPCRYSAYAVACELI